MKKCNNTIKEFAENYRREFIKNWQYAIYELTATMNHLLKQKKYNEEEVRKMYEEKIEHAKEMLSKVDYYVQKRIQQYKKPEPKKDNYNLYNGEVAAYSYPPLIIYDSKIRVPKLKRKTAWKRFYKLYPDLKGKDFLIGNSNCRGEGWPSGAHNIRQSTIKLKKQ